MPNFVYDNKLIQNKYESVLLTDLQDSDFLTVDESLTASAGDTVEIVTRTVSGSVEDVAMGAGNTADITVTGIIRPYKVKTKQGRFIYWDEEAEKDPQAVDAGIQGMAELARNAWVEEAFKEAGKAYSRNIAANSFTFDAFADAVALFGEKDTDLRALVNPKDVAKLRKSLKDDLKYSEDYARTGYVGLVCGVPIKRTAACPEGEILIMKKDAVTLFVKKNTVIEQDRDIDKRENKIITRKVGVCALTKENHVVRIAKGNQFAFSINTVNAGADRITATTTGEAGEYLSNTPCDIYLNGIYIGSDASNEEGMLVFLHKTTIKKGDVFTVVAKRDGEVPYVTSVTVS